MKLLLRMGRLMGFNLGLLAATTAWADYSKHELAEGFVQDMVAKHSFKADEVREILKRANKRQPILDAISRPAEKTKPWRDYRPIFIQPLRITNGVAFWKENQQALNRAEQVYGVPAEVIVAIIGVETNYGRNMGSHYVLDALSTLAFDYPPRAPFFRSELENYLVLTREHQQSPTLFKGSYAGAMGFGQFMPSSYRNFAVDFSGDGFADIWNNPTDAIGSVANYFVKHGWQSGKAVVIPAKFDGERELAGFNNIVPPAVSVSAWKKKGVAPTGRVNSKTPAIAIEFDGANGLEYWLGLQNFYTITRYNRSPMYAMAVHQLSQEIKAAKEKSR
ncbi:lytic murein transglycosylase B [Cellvibrio japonicus]|uniref:Peptidoglycan lytic transglycosylase, putative, plt103A n=1 Tax=Cellvibrio japonicus (strain Ueda107) TaxID=498211 RepID=B3PKN4_CELJU|nr:lytic murein transglycosylase B [Cellvibrio japonicus]ACE85676.1 peptidoglycan lytic transglycosylase, putative, plt103A [Cellvibrio japonicus Ueda107]QEI11444.1 lytic murein transglycosylase B [Cellvibrio japonicus]QEI15018.1 lytic murein transglycosylase B [Cellvibrio japonicus]QEI18598.1 lytic murein transglycosylase B [Cellvibrio japonicus]